jgi:formamidopyrimidine-DNA glycosylase
VPEILEVELYRRAAETVVGHTIVGVDAPDAWFLKRGLTPSAVQRALKKRTVTAARRRGKLLLLDTDGPVLGLRFGMTGRLVVDGRAAVNDMAYGSERDLPGWDRFRLRLDGRRTLRINDPRRLGGVELDPDESALGADAFDLTIGELRGLLGNSAAPVKARLMDQQRIAGIGNLLADEILWRAGIDPARLSRDLDADATRRLHRTIRTVLRDLMERGGSHLGELQPERERDGVCPRDGSPLLRRRIGGRTTYSCPAHQR